jgi:hypothetical protein
MTWLKRMLTSLQVLAFQLEGLFILMKKFNEINMIREDFL